MIAQAAGTVLFYLFAAGAVILALAVVTSRRLLRAGIFLMSVLMASAGLYLMLRAEFLAGVQVLVYIGGIMVLIVFAVMLTAPVDLMEQVPAPRRILLAIAASGGFLLVTGTVLYTGRFAAVQPDLPTGIDVHLVGRRLLDSSAGGHVLAFLVISLLLLAAAIGGIVVARKTPPPGQPFTSGGDLPGEADRERPKSQSEPTHGRPG
jgi:NADH-quinone oxidoreductase subunit J